MLLMVLTMAVGTVNAAKKTITLKNKDSHDIWEPKLGYLYQMDTKAAKNSSTGFNVETICIYKNKNKNIALKQYPKGYFENFCFFITSKKKVKKAVFYMYDDKTGKFKKKLAFNSKNAVYGHDYTGKNRMSQELKKKSWNRHRLIPKKVVITY